MQWDVAAMGWLVFLLKLWVLGFDLLPLGPTAFWALLLAP
jgi:hypothetical protein